MDFKSKFLTVWGKEKIILLLSTICILLVFLTIMLVVLPQFDRGVRLIGMEPSGEITSKTNLTFSFSGDMVEKEKVGKTFSGDYIKFSPAVPGKYRWISQRELRFLPEAAFRPSTKYSAELQTKLAEIKDKYLSGKRNVEFATYRFKVNDASAGLNYLTGKKGMQMQVKVEFNYPVAPAELQKFLRIKLAGLSDEVKYNLNTNENSSKFIITSEPIQLIDKEQKVSLEISRGFQCVGGTLGLEKDYRSSITVGAKKDLNIMEAVSKNDSNECWISIHCSEPVLAGKVADFIKLKPEVPFKSEVDGEYIIIRSEKFESGETYNLRVNSGLQSLNGFPLKREFTTGILFQDLEPSLKFNSKGRYLSNKGYLNLGLETVNIDRVNLVISQIFPNNLVSYLNNLNYNDQCYSYEIPNYGRVIKSSVFQVNGKSNETITTPVNLGEFFTDKYRGIYQVIAYDNDHRWRQDSKYVIITDLGIVVKMGRNELMVWVNSLESLEPQSKVKVSLLSRNNQKLAETFTDGNGVARFQQIQKDTSGFEPFIILAELGKDFSFVNLSNSLIPTVDFDVRGRLNLEEGYEAFLYMDRDVFRPGDQGNLVGIVRAPNAVIPPEFPVKLEIRQPDGQIFKELQSNTKNRGACEFSIPIPDYAQTGKYKVSMVVAGETIGDTTFGVEEFMPERIKVTTKTDQTQYNTGETAKISIEGMNLFGPPAAGRRTQLHVKLEPEPFSPAAFRSYTFGDPDRKFTVIDEELGEDKLDEKGQAEYEYDFPKDLTPPAKLRAVFQSTVIEDGGRAVSNYKSVTLHPYDSYIGIKPLSEDYGEVGKAFPIKFVVTNQEGKVIAKSGLNVEVYRITWNTVYRRDSEGRYSYTSEEEQEKVYSGALTAEAKENQFEYTPKDYGKFRIVLADPDTKTQSTFSFYASGWGYAPWAIDSPEKIDLDLERKVYRIGENAKLQIKAPFSGKALITMERGKVYDYKIINLKNNTGVVSIPVKEGYQPNVYISVHLIRSIKSIEKKNPARAFGTIPLMVDCSNHQSEVEIKVASELRPNREVEVEVRATRTGNKGYLTLAAVDEGICQLTNFNTPNPMDFFYGKRSLAIDSYDLYGMVLPEVAPSQKKLTPGGDADETEDIRKQNLNPVSVRRVKPVSLWSGLVRLENGKAKVRLKIPQFNGTIRFMAVVNSETNFGSAQKKVIVRDPIVISPTFPRFVAPGDQFTVPVSLFNGTGKSGEFALELKTEGPVEVLNESKITIILKDQEEKVARFSLRAKNGIGKLTFKTIAKGNKAVCEVTEELAVRPSVPLTHELHSGVVSAKKPLELNLEQQWLPGTAEYTLILAPFPSLKFAGSLNYLLSYPYGCVEQTSSKIFPLLYFNDLAGAVQQDYFKGGNNNFFISEGIEKLESMQLRDGGFSYWPGQIHYSNDWGSVYAAHCLVEARKAGYNVTDRTYQKMLGFLNKIAKAAEKDEYRLQLKVYALYVLSLAGEPQQSTMTYLKDYSLAKLSNYSRAQLAAAYYYAGDRDTAEALLPESFAVSTQKRETGGNFNSPIRSDAIILSVLADIDPNHPVIPKLVDRLAKEAEIGYWGTTQENAFALMAIGKVLRQTSQSEYTGEVFAGKNKLADFNSKKEIRISNKRLADGPLSVKIKGEGNCYYFMKVSGISNQTDTKEYDHGIAIRRDYFSREGDPVNLNQIRQGDLLIAKLTISTHQDDMENIVIADMLPGGLEIENPRLGENSNLSWLDKSSLTPDYLDIRDDRLLIFASFPELGIYEFYYAVRAVTCGDYVLPSIKAESMYEPEISSYSSGGKISVH